MSKGTLPSYDQITGPDIQVLGTPEDIAAAETIAGSGSRVYAAIRPTEKAIKVVAYAGIKTFAVIPCLWPQLLCLGPCLCSSSANTAANLRNTTYIITNDRIIISVADHSPPCNCCVSSGKDSGEFHFENIIEVVVDNTGKGRIQHLWKTSSVKISLTTREVFLLVENPSEIAAMIRDLRKARSDQRNNPVILHQPIPVAPQPVQNKRIFVAIDKAPEDFKIVSVQGNSVADWEKFKSDVREKFSLPHECHLHLQLADLKAALTTPDDLSANDKVIVSVV